MTHVLMTYPGMIPSVLLCGQYQLEYLAIMGKIEFRSIQRDSLTAEDCGWADVIFLVRSDSELEVELAKKWKRAGKRLVYVLDDDLLNVPDTISSGAFYAQKVVRKSIQTLLELCDVFLSPSEKLREKYGMVKSAPIEEPSLRHPTKVTHHDGPVRIGFAGSVDREKELDELLSKVIETLLEQYGECISVEFFGAHPKLADTNSLHCISYCDSYEEYQRIMEALDWDIGLAPMPNTPFHACKHYNKFVEYAGYGIAGVYSEVAPYTHIVRHGENGLLCGNDVGSWIAAISRLIDDKVLREHISANAQRQSQDELSIQSTALALYAVIGETLSYIAPDHGELFITLPASLRLKVRRAIFALQRYGIHAPAIAVKKIRKRFTKRKEISTI